MVKYLFVDGGCLRSVLEKVSNTYAAGAALDVDYTALTREFAKVFYYDALPEQRAR